MASYSSCILTQLLSAPTRLPTCSSPVPLGWMPENTLFFTMLLTIRLIGQVFLQPASYSVGCPSGEHFGGGRRVSYRTVGGTGKPNARAPPATRAPPGSTTRKHAPPSRRER